MILEEFRQQLGDRIPFAMRALEKSTGKTSAELDKMMKEGKLTSEYIKPLIDEIGNLALANGAYEKALKKLGTVENQLKASGGYAAARVAEAGFTEGLVGLYNDLIKAMEENGTTLDQLGNLYKKVFNALSYVVKYATSMFAALVRTLDFFTDHPAISGLTLITAGLWAASKAAGGLGKALMLALKGPMALITMFLGLMQEVFAIFDENLIGIGENDKASAEDRKIAAAHFRASVGMGSEDDNKMLGGLSKERINLAVANNSGIGAFMGKGVEAVQNYTNTNKQYWDSSEEFQQGKRDFQPFFKGYTELMNLPATVIFNIAGSDPQEIADKVSSKFEAYYDLKAAPTK